MTAGRPIRVLVVEDSVVTRRILSRALNAAAGVEVVGAARDPYEARDRIVELEPDVMTLDLELPRMDGLTFLDLVMAQHPLPVVVVSSLSAAGSRVALEAMALGAVDVVCKPAGPEALRLLSTDLINRVRSAAVARVGERAAAPAAPRLPTRRSVSRRPPHLLAIGASTGGTNALEAVLRRMPPTSPPIVIVQHMPPGITAPFAERLDRLGELEVREAVDGDELRNGLALVAPGGSHLLVHKLGDTYHAVVRDGPLVNRHRPSVDVLFRSVARAATDDAAGLILTGMGGDGARGLLEMRGAGAITFAQDEASSLIYGMPRVAAELGAAQHIVHLDHMTDELCRHCGVLATAATREQ